MLQDKCECEACGRSFTRSVKVDHYRARILGSPCPGLLGLLQEHGSAGGAPGARRSQLLARCRRTAAQKREARVAWAAALAEAKL
eukprot:3787843-Alexandrium_andersonii.AAC.1